MVLFFSYEVWNLFASLIIVEERAKIELYDFFPLTVDSVFFNLLSPFFVLQTGQHEDTLNIRIPTKQQGDLDLELKKRE